MFILCFPCSGIAQDPNDPGEPDTLYFLPGGIHSANGETLYVCPSRLPQDVIFYINVWNDNDVYAMVVPLIDNCYGPPCNAYPDPEKNNYNPQPKCFEGSRVEYFETKFFNEIRFPPRFRLFATIIYEDPLPPGDGLFATLTFTVSDTGRICLDTTFIEPALTLIFVSESQGYTPCFRKKTFVIANREYRQADPNYDGYTSIADAVYLIKYVLRHGPPPCVIKSGDVNCDDIVNIVDIIYFISYLFKHGPEPGYCP
jgi:hypothetical protein